MNGTNIYIAVVEFDYPSDERTVVSIHEWHDWLKIPAEERPISTIMVRARDELEAYSKALKGREWYADLD